MGEEDRKNIIILQESLDKLNEKIKMYKRQLEEQESSSNSNIMRVKKFQRELESSEARLRRPSPASTPSGHNSACLPPPPSPGPGRSNRSSVRSLSRRTSSMSILPAQTSLEQPLSLHHQAQLRWPPRAAAAGQLPSNLAALQPCRPPPPPLCRPPPPLLCRLPPLRPPAGATGPTQPTPGPAAWPGPLQSEPAALAGLAPCSDTKDTAATGQKLPHTSPPQCQ